MTPQCGLCEREMYDAPTARQLCQGCERATGERLDRIARLHTALGAFLTPAAHRPEHGGTRPAEAPLPVREPVLDLVGPGGIVGVLEDWCAAMQKDRGWGPPAIRGDIAHRVLAAARGLRLNLEWIAAEWPEAGQFAAELRDLHAAALTFVDPPEKTYRLGHCTTLNTDGTRCGAILRAPAGTADVRCPWCRTIYPPATWLALRAAQPEQEPAP